MHVCTGQGFVLQANVVEEYVSLNPLCPRSTFPFVFVIIHERKICSYYLSPGIHRVRIVSTLRCIGQGSVSSRTLLRSTCY